MKYRVTMNSTSLVPSYEMIEADYIDIDHGVLKFRERRIQFEESDHTIRAFAQGAWCSVELIKEEIKGANQRSKDMKKLVEEVSNEGLETRRARMAMLDQLKDQLQGWKEHKKAAETMVANAVDYIGLTQQLTQQLIEQIIQEIENG